MLMTSGLVTMLYLSGAMAQAAACDMTASDRQVALGEQLQPDAARMESPAREAIRLCSTNPRAHNLLGTVMELRGNLTAARAAYTEAQKLAPAWYLPALGLADVARQNGARAESRKLYDASWNLATNPAERKQVDEAAALLPSAADSANYGFKSAEVISRSFRIGEKLTLSASSGGSTPSETGPGGRPLGMPGGVLRDLEAPAPVAPPKGAKVLGDGIYQMTDGSVVAHLSITFNVNSTEMTAEGFDQAKQIALGLSRADGSEKFTIEGHASSEGDGSANQSLSAARASALRDYLAAMGVPASIFEVRGFGESNLVIENGVENKEKSRRATLVRRQ